MGREVRGNVGERKRLRQYNEFVWYFAKNVRLDPAPKINGAGFHDLRYPPGRHLLLLSRGRAKLPPLPPPAAGGPQEVVGRGHLPSQGSSLTTNGHTDRRSARSRHGVRTAAAASLIPTGLRRDTIDSQFRCMALVGMVGMCRFRYAKGGVSNDMGLGWTSSIRNRVREG